MCEMDRTQWQQSPVAGHPVPFEPTGPVVDEMMTSQTSPKVEGMDDRLSVSSEDSVTGRDGAKGE
jgi:hypothetical protein